MRSRRPAKKYTDPSGQDHCRALLSLSPDRIKQEDEKEENQSSALFIIAILSLRFEFHIAETNSFYLVLLGETGWG
jgi:hypothetical protein